jgi:hypothetical protein
MATFSDQEALLPELRGVRLGRWERHLLLSAPPPGSGKPGTITGMFHVTGPTRAERQAKFRAARKLEDLGLVHYAKQLRAERGVYIELAPLGAVVVKRYRRELQEGRRIRWPREKGE